MGERSRSTVFAGQAIGAVVSAAAFCVASRPDDFTHPLLAFATAAAIGAILGGQWSRP